MYAHSLMGRLSTASDRRETVLTVAKKSFAARGLYGTPTAEIAEEAGISHAYLFRLFPTKADLFIALVRRCNQRILTTFAEAATEAKRNHDDILATMGAAYAAMLADRDLLLVQLQAHAACDEPAVREEMRRGFAELLTLIERESGAGPEAVSSFFAHGMLLHALSALRADEVDEHWASVLLPEKKDCEA